MTYDTINDVVTIAGGEGTLLANRYRVVRQLGQGGMGSVWLVEDTQLDDKPFAVKMLPSILVSNKRAYRQLKDEALVAMKLSHPNIVTLRAFEENNGNPFLVMDYVDGQTLDDYLADHALHLGEAASRRFNSAPLGETASRRFTGTTGVSPVAHGLPEADVLRILRPIAAALDYAHSKGVVHRDVKPGNVMIAKDGTPYILDFGIAREIQETMTRVTGKLSSGTLLYMSPEQLNGAQPKPAQDVYSFAAMVYECLKGEPPFVRGQIEHQILNNLPEPLDISTAGLSARGSGTLAASVMAGLAKNPEDRPVSCTAVLEENFICSALQEVPVTVSNAKVLLTEERAPKEDDVFAGPVAWKVDMEGREFYCPSRAAMFFGALGALLIISMLFVLIVFGRTMGTFATMILFIPSLLLAIGAKFCARKRTQKCLNGLLNVLNAFRHRDWGAAMSVAKRYEKEPYIQYYQGVCALHGLGGVQKDVRLACDKFVCSAKQGVAEALCALGFMHQHGVDGPINLVQARKFYSEAEKRGSALGKRLLHSLTVFTNSG